MRRPLPQVAPRAAETPRCAKPNAAEEYPRRETDTTTLESFEPCEAEACGSLFFSHALATSTWSYTSSLSSLLRCALICVLSSLARPSDWRVPGNACSLADGQCWLASETSALRTSGRSRPFAQLVQRGETAPSAFNATIQTLALRRLSNPRPSFTRPSPGSPIRPWEVAQIV